jgi:ribosomal protein L37AE/L43A
MGNSNSIHNNTNNNNNNDKCIVCWKQNIENIQNQLIYCSKCHMQMHELCYKNYNEIKNYNFYICPHCQRVGTLEEELWRKQRIFEKSCRNF